MDESVKLAQEIAEKTNYLNKDIVYLKNTNITEYDIASAGFTVIKFKKLLPEAEIAELEKVSKYERNVRIGKRIIQYPNISIEIIQTLEKARKAFVLVNEILPEEILTIKKDAIFLIKKVPTIFQIKEFLFREKGNYTSYCYINKKEFYYSSTTETLDIKGFSQKVNEEQKEYLIKDIKNFLRLSEKITSDQMFSILKSYRAKYLNRELNKESYRDLDSGMFRIGDFSIDSISQENLADIDISQNYINYLVPLFNILV